MVAILIFLWIILLTYFLGERLLRLFQIQPSSFPLKFAFTIGLGFALFAYLMLFLGLMSCLYPWLIALILIALTVIVFYTKRRSSSEIVRNRTPFWFFQSFVAKSMLLIVMVVIALVNILGALTPEVRHDSLQYHQTIPHYFLLEHRIAEVPYTIYYTYALNAEMIYTLAQALTGGDSMLPKLLHCFAAILTAIAVYGLAKRYSDTALIPLLSAAIFYTLPQVAWMSSSAFNENWWMLFGILAIIAWLEWYNSNRKEWLILSALFCGFGIGTKLIAVLFYPLLLGFASVVVLLREKRNKFWIVYFVFWMVLPIAPWLIRNYLYTNNPIYPLLSGYFNSPYPYDIAGQNFATIRSLPPMRFSAILERIRDTFIAININGNGILTAFFIVCVPLLLMKQIPKQIKWLTGYGLVAWLMYAVVEGGTDGRFIYPSYPILAITIGYALSLAIDKIASMQPSSLLFRPTCIVFILCVIMLGTYIHLKIAFVQDFKESWLPVLGKQHREHYLSDRIKIYPMLAYINQTLPHDAKVLLPSGYAALYCNRRYLAHSEFDISPLHDLIMRYNSADRIYSQLRAWSITHLVFQISPTRNSVISELLAKYSTKLNEINGFEIYLLQ
ncbi:MAG: glycosyltransferase family 39 protein [bacterium]|nr:glycosyltransferase family 39 protein [bacterium]